MSKKLITACLGVLALAAFALPAVASASPVLTFPTGTKLAAGSTTCKSGGVCITATNVGTAFLKNDEGTATISECTHVVITGSLTKNSGTEIEGDITTATFSGDGEKFNGMNECKGLGGLGNLTPTTNGTDPEKTFIEEPEDVTNGTPWCINAKGAADTFTVRGGTCADPERPIVFILDSTAGGECKMERATAVEGTYTTDTTGDAILSIAPGASSTFKKVSGGVLCPSLGSLEMKFTMEAHKTTSEPMYIS